MENVVELKIQEANAGHLVKRTHPPPAGPLKGETDGKSLCEKLPRDFPRGPVVETLRFQCGGRGFRPWSGN